MFLERRLITTRTRRDEFARALPDTTVMKSDVEEKPVNAS